MEGLTLGRTKKYIIWKMIPTKQTETGKVRAFCIWCIFMCVKVVYSQSSERNLSTQFNRLSRISRILGPKVSSWHSRSSTKKKSVRDLITCWKFDLCTWLDCSKPCNNGLYTYTYYGFNVVQCDDVYHVYYLSTNINHIQLQGKRYSKTEVDCHAVLTDFDPASAAWAVEMAANNVLDAFGAFAPGTSNW